MATTKIEQLPVSVAYAVVEGDDFSYEWTFQAGGVGIDLTSATVTSNIWNSNDTAAVVPSFTVSGLNASGRVIVTLTDAQTTTLGEGTFNIDIVITIAGYTRTYVAGTLTIVARH